MPNFGFLFEGDIVFLANIWTTINVLTPPPNIYQANKVYENLLRLWALPNSDHKTIWFYSLEFKSILIRIFSEIRPWYDFSSKLAIHSSTGHEMSGFESELFNSRHIRR